MVEHVMEPYRFYLVDDDGAAVTYRDVALSSESTAVQHARELVEVITGAQLEALPCSAIEVWQAGRLIHFEYPASGATSAGTSNRPQVPAGE